MALPYVFQEMFFVAWIGFIPVIYAELYKVNDEIKHLYRSAWFRGLMFFYPYSVVLFSWFASMYPLDFAGLNNAASIAVIIAGIFGLSFLQSALSSFIFVFFRLGLKKFELSRGVTSVFVFAFLWILHEWTGTLGWWAVPWGKLAMGQTDAVILLQSASLFGSYFISFLIICVNGLISVGISFYKNNKSKSICFFTAAVLLFSLNMAYGYFRINYTCEFYSDKKIKAAVIQGNIPSKEKWSAKSLNDTLEIYRSLTVKAAKEGAKIVLWPETAVPYSINTNKNIRRYVEETADIAGCDILVGTFMDSEEGSANSIVLVKKGEGIRGENYYVKRHLVPFGEFVPMRSLFEFLFPPLADIGVISDGIIEGDSAEAIIGNDYSSGALICFDSIFEKLSYETVREGAQFLSLSTNDSWFSDSGAVYQHNRHAVLRAVENGRYILRAANTGISSVIDPYGKIVSQILPFETGYLTEEISLNSSMTFYSITGNVFVLASFVFIFGAYLHLFIEKRKENGHRNKQNGKW